MSRSGYSEDYDSDCPYPNATELYRGAVRSALRGKRGQAFLRELLEALDALPEKKLIAESLQRDGAVCAIGSVGARRGTKMDDLDPEEAGDIAKRFGIAECMVREIEFVNDDDLCFIWPPITDEQRWERVRRWVVRQLENPGSY